MSGFLWRNTRHCVWWLWCGGAIITHTRWYMVLLLSPGLSMICPRTTCKIKQKSPLAKVFITEAASQYLERGEIKYVLGQRQSAKRLVSLMLIYMLVSFSPLLLTKQSKPKEKTHKKRQFSPEHPPLSSSSLMSSSSLLLLSSPELSSPSSPDDTSTTSVVAGGSLVFVTNERTQAKV